MDGPLREFLWLVRCGFPTDLRAENLADIERMAFAIVMGEFEGMEWDWSLMRWKKPG